MPRRCMATPIAMPVSWSASASWRAPKTCSKKSLRLLTDVEAEKRNLQVMFSPRMPQAKVGYLPTAHGKETAPRRGTRSGWMSHPHLSLPNYGSSTSRGYAPHTQKPTTEGWKKPLGFIRSGVSRNEHWLKKDY